MNEIMNVVCKTLHSAVNLLRIRVSSIPNAKIVGQPVVRDACDGVDIYVDVVRNGTTVTVTEIYEKSDEKAARHTYAVSVGENTEYTNTDTVESMIALVKKFTDQPITEE